MPQNIAPPSDTRMAYLESLVSQASAAAAVFTQYTQEDVDRIVKQMVLAGLAQAQHLARLAVEETRLGVMEDKTIKNMVATEFVYNYVKDKRTVGIIREFPESGLVEMAEPIGVIFSLTPITNPTSTVLFKCIMAIKTRNAVVFSPHPNAWRCCAEAVRIMYEAAVKHGAPEGVFTCVEEPTLSDNAWLMHHKDVRLVDATGGRGASRAAYSSGKPALGVGSGNTPVYLEKTADLDMAVVDIITSKTFDNGTICASEQTVVIDDEIYDLALRKFAELGVHICSAAETEILGRTVIDPVKGQMQPMAVGQKVTDIARMIGLRVPPHTRLLIAPIGGVGREYPLSVEKLFPVLAVCRAHSVDEALKLCIDVNHAGGLGHTAVIFSRNDEIVKRFGEVMNAGRIIVNSPGAIGALGGVYNDLVPTFSFGCGTGGGNSTMDNVNVYHYLNIKRVARRTPAHMWFRVPNQIYFDMNAVEVLRGFPSSSTLIVTNPALEQMGHVNIVRRSIPPQTTVHVLAIPDAEPEIKVVMHGVETLKAYAVDQIVALGGGSVIDAAKIMKLKYEFPQADLDELAAPFLDIRKRVVQFPTEKTNHARLIAISTTSGTGSEVTPFAVFTDKVRGRKVTLADYSLSPDVAIVDPQFVMSMPKGLTADTGIDCLTHALGSGRFGLRFTLYRLERHAGDPAGIQVSADRIREPARRRGAQHDAQCRLHCGARIFQRLGGREPRAGACLRSAVRSGARARQRADAAACDRLQCGGAHEVQAIAKPAGIHRAQEVRHDFGPAGIGRSYRRGKGRQAGDRDRTPARPVATAALHRGPGNLAGGIRTSHARVGEDRF